MKLYAFRDISIKSPDMKYLPVAVNLDLELDALVAKMPFANDFEFHNALSMLLNDFKDAHTRYSMPTCYSSFSLKLSPSVSFASVVINKEQVIIVNDATSPYYKQRVFTIDGKDAVSAIADFARDYGRDSNDVGTRFNQVIKIFGARPLATYGIPQEKTIVWETNSTDLPGTRVKVESVFNAYSNKDIGGVYDFKKLCAPSASSEIRNGSIPYIDYLDDGLSFNTREERLEYHKSALSRHIAQMHAKEEEKEKLRRINLRKSGLEASATASPGDILYKTINVEFSLVKPGVGALKMPSFFPSEFGLDTIYNIKSIPEYLFDVQRVYFLAKQHNIKDMIFDLRGNGGGWICLAMELVRLLFPGPAQQTGELFDQINSPLMTQLATQASKLPKDVYSIFSPWKFFRPETFTAYENIDWLAPGKSYTRGGVTSQYSNMVTDDCTMVNLPSWDPSYLFRPEHVLLLSDGTCGSACALFSRNIQERALAQTMVVGGLKNEPQMIASFIGGLVYDLPTLLEELKLLNLLDSPYAPKPFPTSAGLRFTLWEQYPWANRANPPIPAEFVFEASDFRLMYTLQSLYSPLELYTDAYNVWKQA